MVIIKWGVWVYIVSNNYGFVSLTRALHHVVLPLDGFPPIYL